MDSCPKCAGQIVLLKPQEAGFFRFVGAYFFGDLGFWIVIGVLASVGLLVNLVAAVIGTLVFILIFFVLTQPINVYQCTNCNKKFKSMGKRKSET